MTTMTRPPGTRAADETAERVQVGQRFVAALVAQDFTTLASLLGPTMRMRSLLASGHHDFHGGDEVLAAFAGWFGQAALTPLETSVDTVGDRLMMSWRFRIERPDFAEARVVEQRSYSKVADGRIVSLDLGCSGFRPV